MCTVRAVANGAIATQAAGVATSNSWNFTLAAANVGSGFWDQYRIQAVRFTIRPENNAIGLVTNSTTQIQPLYCVIDYDDSTNLASIAAAESYSTCIVLSAGESCERVIQPRIAVAAYNGAFGGFANLGNQWIDSASSTVQHYGIKTYVPGGAAGQTQLATWDVIVEYYIQFRKSI